MENKYLTSVVVDIFKQTCFNGYMKTIDAISKAGGIHKLAELLGISVQAIYQWGEEVPKLRQYELREIFSEQKAAA